MINLKEDAKTIATILLTGLVIMISIISMVYGAYDTYSFYVIKPKQSQILRK